MQMCFGLCIKYISTQLPVVLTINIYPTFFSFWSEEKVTLRRHVTEYMSIIHVRRYLLYFICSNQADYRKFTQPVSAYNPYTIPIHCHHLP